MDGQTMDDGACLYYKLTNEPKGSGKLKKLILTKQRPNKMPDKHSLWGDIKIFYPVFLMQYNKTGKTIHKGSL